MQCNLKHKKVVVVVVVVVVIQLTKFPPNMRVQMLEAPPPGETPVTKRPRKFKTVKLALTTTHWLFPR